MFHELAAAIIANAAPLNLASFLLGLILGHRFSLWRDKRNELNQAIKPIRSWLVKQLDNIDAELDLPDITDVDMLQQLLPRRTRKRFTTYWQLQKNELHKGNIRNPVTGLDHFSESSERKAALEKLLVICTLK